jgi:hypothetical protein
MELVGTIYIVIKVNEQNLLSVDSNFRKVTKVPSIKSSLALHSTNTHQALIGQQEQPFQITQPQHQPRLFPYAFQLPQSGSHSAPSS